MLCIIYQTKDAALLSLEQQSQALQMKQFDVHILHASHFPGTLQVIMVILSVSVTCIFNNNFRYITATLISLPLVN